MKRGRKIVILLALVGGVIVFGVFSYRHFFSFSQKVGGGEIELNTYHQETPGDASKELEDIELCGKTYRRQIFVRKGGVDPAKRIGELAEKDTTHAICQYIFEDDPKGNVLEIETQGAFLPSFAGPEKGFVPFVSINRKEFVFDIENNFITMLPYTQKSIIGKVLDGREMVPKTLVRVIDAPQDLDLCGRSVTVQKQVYIFDVDIVSRTVKLVTDSDDKTLCDKFIKDPSTGDIPVSVEALPEPWQMKLGVIDLQIGGISFQVYLEEGVIAVDRERNGYILGRVTDAFLSPLLSNLSRSKMVSMKEEVVPVTICGKRFEAKQVFIKDVSIVERFAEITNTLEGQKTFCEFSPYNDYNPMAYWKVIPLDIKVTEGWDTKNFGVDIGHWWFNVNIDQNNISVGDFDGSRVIASWEQ